MAHWWDQMQQPFALLYVLQIAGLPVFKLLSWSFR